MLEISDKGRFASISMVRFIAMLMIIVCHLFQFYDNEICRWLNVGVQIFFVISGFLYGAKEIENPIGFLFKTFRKILVPYWVFLVLAVSLYLIFCPSEVSLTSVLKAIVCAGTLPGLGHLWFVGYILFCYFLTPYLYWIRKKISPASSVLTVLCIYFSLLLLIQIVGIAFNSYFLPDRISCFVVGFFAMDMIRRFGNNMKTAIIVFFLSFAIIMSGVEIYLKYIAEVSLTGNVLTLFNAWCRYGHLFLGVALFFVLNEIFHKIRYSWLLRMSDKYSYEIYIVHLLFILSPLSFMSLTGSSVVNIILILFASVVSSIILRKASGFILSIIVSKSSIDK